MSETEIKALIDLLEDENPRVQAAVGERLSNLGQDALRALEAAAQDDDPRRRVRARMLWRRLAADLKAAELEAVVKNPAASIEEMAILLACMESPDLDPEPLRRELDRLGLLVRAAAAPATSAPERAIALGRVLHDREGFIGNAKHYYDPRNSYLDQILARRLGIPISLATVYILAGRRAGLSMHGVGMPMHFLALYREGAEDILIDPFGGGRLMTREACRALLSGSRHSFREDYLRPVSDRTMLRRIISNLVRIYIDRKDQERLARLYRLVQVLQEQQA